MTDKALTYSSYLHVDDLLAAQQPLSDGPEHDELLFIVIHQVYELWFKQQLHEAAALQVALESGDSHRCLALLGRMCVILKTMVAQIDVLETMTPLQFNAFRGRLESASGFQSAQFRELEAVLGDRKTHGVRAQPAGSPPRLRIEAAQQRRSVWDSFMRYLDRHGHVIASTILERDVTQPWEADESVQAAIVDAYRNDPECAQVAERLLDLDEGLQEWRYRHVKMVERTIGAKMGSGGSSGVGYLASTLFHPAFPDLWEIRSQL